MNNWRESEGRDKKWRRPSVPVRIGSDRHNTERQRQALCDHDWQPVGLDSWACKKCHATKTAIV